MTRLDFENTQQEMESLVDEEISKFSHNQTKQESRFIPCDLEAEGIKLNWKKSQGELLRS